jgi:transposase
MSQAYLGIDLHKTSSTWMLLDGDGKVLKKQVVPCTPQHVRAAARALPVPAQSVSAVIEPVCGWRWFAETLEEFGVDMHIASPNKIRLIAESRLKHDTLDARMLAELLKSGFLPEAYRASDEVCRVRELIRERSFLIYARTAVKNRIHGVLARDGLHRLKHSPMRKAGQVEIRIGGDSELARLQVLVEDITAHVEPLDKKIEQLARTVPLVKLLKTMPGVGDVTAVTVYGEVGDFARFPTAGKLAAYSGLVPTERSSGGKKQKLGHITKEGSRILRSAMVEAAFRMRRSDGPLSNWDTAQLTAA